MVNNDPLAYLSGIAVELECLNIHDWSDLTQQQYDASKKLIDYLHKKYWTNFIVVTSYQPVSDNNGKPISVPGGVHTDTDQLTDDQKNRLWITPNFIRFDPSKLKTPEELKDYQAKLLKLKSLLPVSHSSELVWVKNKLDEVSRNIDHLEWTWKWKVRVREKKESVKKRN